ncbi:MAG: class I SAM-dependent methyltransferase [Candidatus Saganbacteria bacterium]|nr:class I SAM-dependent methyltransferase [Candidatus Saganbacteria bacterium]
MNPRKEETQKRFDADAKAYEERIIKHVNGYLDLHLSIMNMIPFKPDQAFKVLDLGIGSGRLAKQILEKYPKARLTAVDFSDKMIAMCRSRLAEFSDRIELLNEDFDNNLPPGKFDLVIMILSLHHLEDPDKASMIKLIHKNLNKPGALLIGDLTKSAYPRITKIYMDLWRQNLRDNGYDDGHIENCYREKYQKEDIPATLEDQLQWLKAAKFDQIEVFWKRYHFVGFGGFKGIK